MSTELNEKYAKTCKKSSHRKRRFYIPLDKIPILSSSKASTSNNETVTFEIHKDSNTKTIQTKQSRQDLLLQVRQLQTEVKQLNKLSKQTKSKWIALNLKAMKDVSKKRDPVMNEVEATMQQLDLDRLAKMKQIQKFIDQTV